MATNSSTRNDTPSIIPTPRTRPTGLLHTVRSSHSQLLLPLRQLLGHLRRGRRAGTLERDDGVHDAEGSPQLRTAAGQHAVESLIRQLGEAAHALLTFPDEFAHGLVGRAHRHTAGNEGLHQRGSIEVAGFEPGGDYFPPQLRVFNEWCG